MNVPASPAAGASPRGRLQFILLATLFFFPLLASYALYFLFPDLRPSGTVNYGELVLPTRTLPDALSFLDARGEALDTAQLVDRRWTYVVLAGEGDCADAPCLNALIMTRQVRLATNEKRSRVQRVLVLAQGNDVEAISTRLAREHPDLRVVAETGDAGARLSTLLVTQPAPIHLIDPLGNWVMRYPGGREKQTDFKGMNKDLGKLLRLSQIG
ncbi:MAG: hypothetical protein ACT4QA_02390 [Panacagrimonas sp.]